MESVSSHSELRVNYSPLSSEPLKTSLLHLGAWVPVVTYVCTSHLCLIFKTFYEPVTLSFSKFILLSQIRFGV